MTTIRSGRSEIKISPLLSQVAVSLRERFAPGAFEELTIDLTVDQCAELIAALTEAAKTAAAHGGEE